MLKCIFHVAMVSGVVLGPAVVSLSKPAEADGRPMCAERQELLTAFAQGYAETPSAIGLASTGGVLELLTSNSGSWTVFMTFPSGLSCLVATAARWIVKRPEPHASTS